MLKIILIICLMAGCASITKGMEQSDRLNSMHGISIGMSQDGVLKAWGRPISVKYGAYSTMWIYRNYRGRVLGTHTTYVHFNKSGCVTNWSGYR
jgi:uncharacterized protein YceK